MSWCLWLSYCQFWILVGGTESRTTYLSAETISSCNGLRFCYVEIGTGFQMHHAMLNFNYCVWKEKNNLFTLETEGRASLIFYCFQKGEIDLFCLHGNKIQEEHIAMRMDWSKGQPLARLRARVLGKDKSSGEGFVL